MRKVFALAVVAAMGMGLTGCGGDNKAPAKPADKGAETKPADTKPADTKPAEKPAEKK